jgi:predicted amidohydrolase
LARLLGVAAIQMGVHRRSKREGLEEAEMLLREAAKGGARLVCLPEHWLGSQLVEPHDELYERFGALAQELGMYINLGGFYERSTETFFVSPTLSPQGQVISKQAKVHLYGSERELASPGRGFEVFEVDGVKVGVLVCHDVVFPESARSVVLKGAELLLVPSLIVERGTEPWHIYLMARALENRVPVVAPNAYAPPFYMGKSVVLDLDFDAEQKVMLPRAYLARDGRGIVAAQLDLDRLVHHRLERLRERRPGAYWL